MEAMIWIGRANTPQGPMGASQQSIPPVVDAPQSLYARNGLPDLMQSQQWNLLPPSGPGVDMFSPSFDLYNSDFLAGPIDLIQNDINHGFLDIDGWDYGRVGTA